MRSTAVRSAVRTSIAVVTAAAVGALCPGPIAHAEGDANSYDDIAINGTFIAFSDGVWAKTNDSLHEERSVTQVWTITSTCTTFEDCTGQVISDHGWTGDLVYLSGRWRVRHVIEDWEPCWDGTAWPGTQTFIFWQEYERDPNVYVGWDRTEGPSGACGSNRVLDIEMPFRLTRQS